MGFLALAQFSGIVRQIAEKISAPILLNFSHHFRARQRRSVNRNIGKARQCHAWQIKLDFL